MGMELIKIYDGRTVSAKELHQFLGPKSKFADWFRNRIKRYEFLENEDYVRVSKILDTPGGKQETIDYALTLNMAKELSMVENNAKGREARRYFIKAEEALIELYKNKRFEAFSKLQDSLERLRERVLENGFSDADYLQIDTEGRKVLFNGKLIEDANLNLLLLKGRDFAVELTRTNIKEGDSLKSMENTAKIHHGEVREVLGKSGIQPEEVPEENDIKKLEE